MSPFNKFEKRRDFRDNRGSGGDRFDSGRRQMHSATCGECGQRCEVPFKPSGDRPVFCKDCFQSKGGRNPSHDSGNPRFAPKSFGDDNRANNGESGVSRAQLDSLNVKLDRIIALLTPAKTSDIPEMEDKPIAKKTKAAAKKSTAKKK